MKNLFALMTLSLMSLPAFSQTCYVDMVDHYGRAVRTFAAQDAGNSCMEGMKECRKAIRLSPELGGVDCVRYPRTTPAPNPAPNPNPFPQPEGYPHVLRMGEPVYNVSNSRYAEVISQDYNGKFVLRYENGSIGTGWERIDLAPLRGCDGDLCVGDEVYNVSNSRWVEVAGLQMTNRFVLKYRDNGSTGHGWERVDLAVPRGCQLGICVGQRVINVSNRRYAVVAALQYNNKFVLKYEDNGLVGHGWELSDLAPIR